MQEELNFSVGGMGKKTISSPFAGSWYPGNPEELRKFFREVSAETEPDEETIALIMPHAGYVYSGTAAGLAAARVKGLAFERVILLAPSHRAYLNDQFCLPDAETFSTPMGDVQVDTDAVNALLQNEHFLRDDRIHRNEHSTQLEIPFLQYMLQPGFRLLPIIVGICSEEILTGAARALKPLIDSKTLVVASSDFTHYGRRFGYMPYGNEAESRVRERDCECARLLSRMETEEVLRRFTGGTICGITPAMIISRIAELKGRTGCTGLFCTSDDITGSRSENFVSYQSVLWRR